MGLRKSFTDREATAEELIVGKWFIEEWIDNGTPEPLTDCERSGYFQFSADDGVLTFNCMTESLVKLMILYWLRTAYLVRRPLFSLE
ncbi:lipocalin family protein [Bizionia sp.]|uniref:lipocalin family protein n=1 Tax=Bizionia sp. TaxID=1954480 RepID=UPI003A944F3B